MPYRKRTRLWNNVFQWKPKQLCEKDCGNIINNTHSTILMSGTLLPTAMYKELLGVKESQEFSSPIYKLRLDMVGRILNQDPSLYADIEILNKRSKKAIKTYLNTQKKLLKIINKKDKDGFVRYFKEAADYLGDFKEEAEEYSDYVIQKIIEREK